MQIYTNEKNAVCMVGVRCKSLNFMARSSFWPNTRLAQVVGTTATASSGTEATDAGGGVIF